MSTDEPRRQTSPQERALRQALRQRERSAAHDTNAHVPEGPPDLSEVFGKVFGLFKSGGAHAARGDAEPASRGRADPGEPRLRSWREALSARLAAARERIEEAQREAASAAKDARLERSARPAPTARPQDTEAVLETPAERVVPARRVARPAAAVRRDSRPARLRADLRNPHRVREIVLANELLGPPLARRRGRHARV